MWCSSLKAEEPMSWWLRTTTLVCRLIDESEFFWYVPQLVYFSAYNVHVIRYLEFQCSRQNIFFKTWTLYVFIKYFIAACAYMYCCTRYQRYIQVYITYSKYSARDWSDIVSVAVRMYHTSATMTPTHASMDTRPCFISASRHFLISAGVATSDNSSGSKICSSHGHQKLSKAREELIHSSPQNSI